MTKEEVIQKIQKILEKNPLYKDVNLNVVFKDKKNGVKHEKKNI